MVPSPSDGIVVPVKNDIDSYRDFVRIEVVKNVAPEFWRHLMWVRVVRTTSYLERKNKPKWLKLGQLFLSWVNSRGVAENVLGCSKF